MKTQIWIIEEDVSVQMVMNEALEANYDLYFFDDILSMNRYRAFSKSHPDLLIANALHSQGRVEDYLFSNDFSTHKHASLALVPSDLSLVNISQINLLFDKTLQRPFSLSEFTRAVFDLTEKKDPSHLTSLHLVYSNQPRNLVAELLN